MVLVSEAVFLVFPVSANKKITLQMLANPGCLLLYTLNWQSPHNLEVNWAGVVLKYSVVVLELVVEQ